MRFQSSHVPTERYKYNPIITLYAGLDCCLPPLDLLVNVLGMGFVSAAVATSVSLWLSFVMLAAYVSISLPDRASFFLPQLE
jgi:Na+-driven multidrug efflux pump